jgi:DNA-binding LytR/AlgR family response regulator
MKIKCLVVDDEQLARKLLESYVQRIPFLHLVCSCKNALEAMESLQNEPIDLMFLDIQMPGLTGVDFIQSLQHRPLVIFTTAYKEYAIQAYQLDVMDYLLKPITFERFLLGVNKAAEHIRLTMGSRGKSTTVRDSDEMGGKNYISLKADRRIFRVPFDTILYIEGAGEYVSFYTTEKKITVLESMKHLEEILPARQFVRIHKSYIVNRGKVRSIYGNLVEIKDKQIPIGKSYLGLIKDTLF